MGAHVMDRSFGRRQFVQGAGAAALALGVGAHSGISVARAGTAVEAAATVPGFGGAVDISMVVDVEKGTVSDVSIKAPYETPSRGGVAREKIEETMNASGSIDVDTVSGATVTSVAILDAAAHAYGEALGTLPQSSEMAPGTYRASSYGFYPGLPVEVEVTVGADAIESVQIVGENLETEPMLRAVEETYIPRIIEGQSLSVDVVTGATMTSSAVRLAAEQCVKDAYAAADVAPEAVFSWLKAADYGTPDPVALDADVVVIGLGGSGLAAALSAVENGLDVIAIDKAGKYGGTTCVTSESFAMNPAGMEADRNGGQDFVDAEELKADWRERAHGDAKDAMLDLFFAESGATIDWLNDEHDWPYNLPNPGHADYATYDCCFTYDPYTLSGRKTELSARIDGLVRQYTDLGGRMLLEVEAQELLADEATNAVVGVRAVGYDGTEYTVNARAVVLATGGFGENTPLMNTYMVDDYFPLAGTWHLYGMATNTGLMIAEALRLGAATYNPSVPPISHLAGFPVNLFGFGTNRKDEESFFTGYTAIWSEGDIPQTLCVAADSLAVTRSGKRFINEEEFASHGAIKAGPEYYTIWSQAQLDTFKTQGLSYEDPGPSMGYLGCQSTIPLGVPLTQIDAVMEAAVATGYVQRADTVAELAGLIEIDPAVLEATVDAYNEACAAGIDEEFGKNPDYLVPVAEGPYYAVLGCAFYYTTSGGLDVDENLQVLREDGTTIEGLYAVGTDSMGVLMTNQEQYLDYGGAASGWAFTSGRLVGKALAEKLG